MFKIILLFISSILISSMSFGETLECKVSSKFSYKGEYSKENLLKYKPSLKIEFTNDQYYVSRCSFETVANKVTCDKHKMDKVVVDSYNPYKKLYHFSSQFDVQLFGNNSFIENNGRKSISYGKCKITKY